jgi:ElaB/YqjD/DUF883 family membrane-anchored ribosome-binding protein
MGQDAEELRQDIAATRNNLGDTLDAIGDRVSPGRMIERRKNRMSAGVRSAVDRVMGTAHDAADSVRDAPGAVASNTQGAPLVAGAIAFAGGFLIAVAFPATEQEAAVTERFVEPVKQELGNVGHELADHLKEPAQEALGQVKETARDGVQTVKDTATQTAADTKDHAQQAVQSVRDEAGKG